MQTTNAADCRGELASVDNMGNFPAKNDVGLPLANPPPPRDFPELKEVYRYFSKFSVLKTFVSIL